MTWGAPVSTLRQAAVEAAPLRDARGRVPLEQVWPEAPLRHE